MPIMLRFRPILISISKNARRAAHQNDVAWISAEGFSSMATVFPPQQKRGCRRGCVISLLLGGLILSLGAARAADGSSTVEDCEQSTTSDLKNSLNRLNEMEGWIELVPQDEARYIAEEHAAALTNLPRYKKLVSRPYYYAWKVHNEFQYARGSLQAVTELEDKNGTMKRKIQAAAIMPSAILSANDAFDDYVKADRKHVLNKDQSSTVIFHLR